MKKIILSVLTLIFVVSLTGCKAVPLNDYTADEILTMVYESELVVENTKEFASNMGLETLNLAELTQGFFVLDTIPSENQFGLNLEGLNLETVESGATLSAMITTSLYTDFVIKVNTEEDIDAVVAFLETYKENVWAYPGDMDTKENAQVVVNGNTVALFLNPNYETFQEAFLGLQ